MANSTDAQVQPLSFDDLGAKTVLPAPVAPAPPTVQAKPLDFSDLGATRVTPLVQAGQQPGAEPSEAPSFLHGVAESTITPITQTAVNVGRYAQTIYNEAGEHLKNGEYLKAAGTLLGALAGADERNPTIQMFHGILDAHKEQLKTSAAMAKQGRWSEAVGHGLAGVTPVVGPAAAKAGEDIGQGQIAYGFGQGAGLLATVLAPRVIGGAVPKVVRAVGATPEVAEQVVKGERVAPTWSRSGITSSSGCWKQRSGIKYGSNPKSTNRSRRPD